MLIRYTLECRSHTAQSALTQALRTRDMSVHLHPELNYIITEFCNFTTPNPGEQTRIPCDTMREMTRCLEHFLSTGTPSKTRLIGSVSGFVQRIRQQLAAELASETVPELPSPTRSYSEEDYEYAELCLEWLHVGLSVGAYIAVTVKPLSSK